jgi:uncharacterized protein YrrD
MMHIEFGDEIYSSDGAKLGSVAGVVMNSENHDVTGIVLGEGLFKQDQRLVGISAVASVDNAAKRVTLDIPESQAESLQRFVTEEYVQKPRDMPDELIMPAAGVGGPIFYDTSATATGYTNYPGTDSFFDVAPLDPPVVETRSNLSDLDVVLNTGTDVYGSDNKKIGTVDDVQFDEGGELAGFIVRAGFLFHHDISIPGSAVAEIDDNRVQLNITSEQAEATGRMNT